MAILHLEDGRVLKDLELITSQLAPLKVQLNRWTIPEQPELNRLITQANLNPTEKAEVLASLDGFFEQLKQQQGYQSRDLIVLEPNTPNLDELLAKFNRCHIHADDEVRYIIDGEGVFGFILPNGKQVELTIQPEEYINVPSGTEHWFHLTDSKRVKAVRYFSDTSGWVPEYTDTPIRFPLLVRS